MENNYVLLEQRIRDLLGKTDILLVDHIMRGTFSHSGSVLDAGY